MQAAIYPYQLIFKQPSGTSRGILHKKDTFFLVLKSKGKIGIGECALFRGLSCDDQEDYEEKLQALVDAIESNEQEIIEKFRVYPSIVFGFEQAVMSLKAKETFELNPSVFTQGQAFIPINGLVWMGAKQFMKEQIDEKLRQGFKTIKLKIGAIDFKEELALLKYIRQQFSVEDITIRVDANGAFNPSDALEKLKYLSDYDLHSIEQPIKSGQWSAMKELCQKSPLDIALDEELIGIHSIQKKQELIKSIQPQYIILKPSLHGGFTGSDEWIEIAENHRVGWWITSALESNIGLNAIAQYTYKKNVHLPQGLGTGGLFTNNFDAPLVVNNGHLHYNPAHLWNTQKILHQISQ